MRTHSRIIRDFHFAIRTSLTHSCISLIVKHFLVDFSQDIKHLVNLLFKLVELVINLYVREATVNCFFVSLHRN